ncbi:hypothetical protein BGW80DRAFT_470155 [Lactifluus volemus]|nr:hypothetical protein BGW80DRAFT_470155 [Lactifluus volemus]
MSRCYTFPDPSNIVCKPTSSLFSLSSCIVIACSCFAFTAHSYHYYFFLRVPLIVFQHPTCSRTFMFQVLSHVSVV